MNKLNETTRCFPRTLEDAFEESVEAQKRRQQWEWMEHHVPSNENLVNALMCFFVGFIVSMVIFVK